MGYHIDDASMSLASMAERLESSDLIPSHLPHLEGVREKIAAMEESGLSSVAMLRRELEKPATLSSLSARSGIAESCLVLLRSAIEGWFPKPPPLSECPGIHPTGVAALTHVGIIDCRELFEAAVSGASRRTSAELQA
jgi:hypothetical protein